MDTTVALFFSLGIVMSPTEQPNNTIETNTNPTVTAQQTVKMNTKAVKRHALVKKRIAVTNAWLADQRQQRRQLAQVHRPIQVSLNQNLSACNADWQYT